MLDSCTTEDRVIVRLDGSDAEWLSAEAESKGMAPEEWMRRLVRAHRHREPQWSRDDLNQMADVASAVAQIRTLVQKDHCRSIGSAIGDALLKAFIARVTAEADRQREYWGVPQETAGEAGQGASHWLQAVSG